ncbi:type IV secretion system protein VirB5 [Oxalobacteraceae bacterium GrIS 1.11]
MKKFLRILAFVVGIFGGSQAFGGIPVIDVTSVAVQQTQLAQAIQQVAAWAQQYEQMVQQIQQMQQQIQNTTGGRGFSALLNDSTFQAARRMLPPDAQTLLSLANGGSYGNLASSINSIKQATTSLNSGSFSSATAANQWQADLNRAASNKALSMEAYTDAIQRLQNLEGMISQVSQTQDPKAIGELQARINAEQGIIQNEQAKIQAMSMLVSAEKQIAEQQARETSIKTAGSVASIPRIQVTP